MSHYRKHVFFCTHERANPDPNCAAHNASAMRDYAKERIKALGLDGPGNVRINNAGCLGRCLAAPVLVVYPDSVWYTYQRKEDIDEIITQHLVGEKIVERLKI